MYYAAVPWTEKKNPYSKWYFPCEGFASVKKTSTIKHAIKMIFSKGTHYVIKRNLKEK